MWNNLGRNDASCHHFSHMWWEKSYSVFHSSDEEPWLGNYVVWFRWETSFIVYQKIELYLENKNIYFQLVHFRLSYVVVSINIELIYLFSAILKPREKNIIIWFIKKALERKYSFLSQLTWHSETKNLVYYSCFWISLYFRIIGVLCQK